MKAFALIAVAATLVAMAAPASAQFAKPEDAIKYRQSALFVMSQHFGRIGAMVNGRVPFDAKAAADNAEIVAEMAKLPWAAFAAGTDKGATYRPVPAAEQVAHRAAGGHQGDGEGEQEGHANAPPARS